MTSHGRRGQREGGAAGAVPEQGEADDHVGQVVPLDDGEHPQQQHLVAEGTTRYQGQREQRQAPQGGGHQGALGWRS